MSYLQDGFCVDWQGCTSSNNELIQGPLYCISTVQFKVNDDWLTQTLYLLFIHEYYYEFYQLWSKHMYGPIFGENRYLYNNYVYALILV